jgi:putative proteasome-type protease
MKSDVSVGPPIDLLVYPTDEFSLTRWRRFRGDDPDLARARKLWEQALRRAVARLPEIRFAEARTDGPNPAGDLGAVVRHGTGESGGT